MHHRLARLLALAGLVCLGLVAMPSLGLAQRAMPIAEALDEVKLGDYFTVEGTVVDSEGKHLYYIEDDSGRMPVYIKDHLLRETGEIKRNDRLRIWGKHEHARLDVDFRGMVVSNVKRLPAKIGASGAHNPTAKDAAVVPIDRSALPAAPAVEPGDVIRPMATEDFKRRASEALDTYRKAEQDAVAAGEAYARAAREAGRDGQVDAEIVARLEATEARVVETRSRIPALVNEAREAGIDEAVVQMIEREAKLR